MHKSHHFAVNPCACVTTLNNAPDHFAIFDDVSLNVTFRDFFKFVMRQLVQVDLFDFDAAIKNVASGWIINADVTKSALEIST